MEIIFTCPFGRECEEVRDGKIYRCRIYCNIKGKNPQSEEIIDQWDCAFSWLPVLLVENAQTNRGQTQALESFRNEISKNQKEFNLILLSEMERRRSLEMLEEKVSLMILEDKEKKRNLLQSSKRNRRSKKEE